MLRRSLLLSLLLLALAGCKSSSFVGKRVDNFTAYYNTFYNAKKSFTTGVKALERADEKIDLTLFLPVFTTADRAGSGQDFEDAIKKSADVLRKHTDSKWVDDALLLIGKSYFYQQNYVGAEQKFREIMDAGSSLEDEARFWLARALIAGGAFTEAAEHLQASLNREDLSSRWEPMLRLALGELRVQQRDWAAAVTELEQGVGKVKDKDFGARAAFLLGQVQEKLGQYDEAVLAFKRVDRFRPLYELSYAAQYSATRIQGLYLDGEAALRMLRKMERNDNNYTYRAELAYLRGRIFQAIGRTDDAFDTYDLLLYNDDLTLNITQIRGRIHYALGELYRDGYEDYVFAAAHFDTASTTLQQSAGRGGGGQGGLNTAALNYTVEAITDSKEQKEIFASFDRVHDEITRLDSLLSLGDMDDKAFAARILELRKARAEELAEQRRRMEDRQIQQRFQQTGNNNNDGQVRGNPDKVIPGYNDQAGGNANAGFLFHRDPIRVQDGRVNFTTQWGRRPLVPNWRRQEAIQGQERASTEGGEEAEGGLNDEEALLAGEELPPIDISSVPRDSTSKATMRGNRAVARYEMGNVLFLSIGRPDSAAVWYRKVIDEDNDQTVAQRAFYALAEVQSALGDTLAARRIYEQVLQSYPGTDFAVQVRERLGITDAGEGMADSLSLAEGAYALAYAQWEQGAFRDALNHMISIAGLYRTTDVTPRALLAAGSIYTEWAVTDSLDLFGELPLAVSDSLLEQSGLRVVPKPTAPDTLRTLGVDVGLPADSLTLPVDSLMRSADSLAVETRNTVPAVPDSVAQSSESLGKDDVAPPVLAKPEQGPTEPEPIRVTTLYDRVVSLYGRTPFSERAQRQLSVLKERREADEKAFAQRADSLAKLIQGSDVALPLSFDSLRVAPDTSLFLPPPAGEALPPLNEPAVEAAEKAPAQPSIQPLKDVEDRGLFKQAGNRPSEGDPPPAKGEEEKDTPAAFVVPLVTAEVMPALIGGETVPQELFRYPSSAKRAGVEGLVVVTFVVDEEGAVLDPIVRRGPGSGCDEEALRVTRLVRYSPGSQDGVPVRVQMSLAFQCKE